MPSPRLFPPLLKFLECHRFREAFSCDSGVGRFQPTRKHCGSDQQKHAKERNDAKHFSNGSVLQKLEHHTKRHEEKHATKEQEHQTHDEGFLLGHHLFNSDGLAVLVMDDHLPVNVERFRVLNPGRNLRNPLFSHDFSTVS